MTDLSDDKKQHWDDWTAIITNTKDAITKADKLVRRGEWLCGGGLASFVCAMTIAEILLANVTPDNPTKTELFFGVMGLVGFVAPFIMVPVGIKDINRGNWTRKHLQDTLTTQLVQRASYTYSPLPPDDDELKL